MSLNQTINAFASTSNSSLSDIINIELLDKIVHTVYIDKQTGGKIGSGTLTRPFNSLDSALSALEEGTQVIIAPESYDIPDNFCDIHSFLCTGDRSVNDEQEVKMSGELAFSSNSHDLYFKNISFSNQNGTGSNPIISFSGYDGKVIFEDCNFTSKDGESVIKFGVSNSCKVIFRNCTFNPNSNLIQSEDGNGAEIIFDGFNSIAPSLILSNIGYSVTVEGGICGFCDHKNGKLALRNVSFPNWTNEGVCIQSSAAAASDNSIVLYSVNTQNSKINSDFGKIVKSGDSLGWYYGIVNPIVFTHDFGNMTSLDPVSNNTASKVENIKITKKGAIEKNPVKGGIEILHKKNEFELSLAPASSSTGGAVSIEDQSFKGLKSFDDGIKLNNISSSVKDADYKIPIAINNLKEAVDNTKELLEGGSNTMTDMVLNGKPVKMLFKKIESPKKRRKSESITISSKRLNIIQYSLLSYVTDSSNPYMKGILLKNQKEMEEFDIFLNLNFSYEDETILGITSQRKGIEYNDFYIYVMIWYIDL